MKTFSLATLHICELFWYYKERKNSNGYFFFCFLTWIFWVLRFLFPWTLANSFLRPKKLFLQKNLLYCTFWYILVTPPIILTFWLNGPWPLHCNQLCELFWYYKERKNSNGYFFCFLTWTFWVLRFLDQRNHYCIS